MKILLLLTILLLATCPSWADEEIRIAAIFSKTGPASKTAPDYYAGVQFAAEQINEMGGLLGKKIRIIEYDNQSRPIGSAQAAMKAVENRVIAVIGAAWSSHSLAMAPILQKNKIIMISPVSTHPKLTHVGDYIFRIPFTDGYQASMMARFAKDDLNTKSGLILTNIDSEYSQLLSAVFFSRFQELGGTILDTLHYREKGQKFQSIVDQINQQKPDVVYLPGYSQDSALIIKAAKEQGASYKFLGGDGWNFAKLFEIGGPVVTGEYYSDHWHTDINLESSQAVKQTYLKRFGTPLTNVAFLQAYDAVMVLTQAIETAGGLSPPKIKDTLFQLPPYEGSTGTIDFDQNGDQKDRFVVIKQLHNQSTRLIKLIHPKREDQ